MNTFGRLFRVSIFGESHGVALGVTLGGCLPGVLLSEADFAMDLDRRKPHQVGSTPRREADVPRIVSGVYQGRTTGAPITVLFDNTKQDSSAYAGVKEQPRPGHADFVSGVRYGGFADLRGGGHFSGRLTLGLVAAGVLAKKLLSSAVTFRTQLASAGGNADIQAAIQEAVQRQDSIGGLITCAVTGLPVGWGEPFFDSIESVLAHILFAIPAVKGVSFGSGFAAATMYGSEHNDALIDKKGATQTNHAGGIVGGLSNSNPLLFSVAIKPSASTPQLQKTMHLGHGKIEPLQVRGRHDLCIALRAPVVVEAAAAMVLADFSLLHKAYT